MQHSNKQNQYWSKPSHTNSLKQLARKQSYLKQVYGLPKPMSILVASMLGLSANTAMANVNSSTASKITGVTIYQGTASVQRQLPISGSGEQHLVFGCLSGKIESNSIQVSASPSVNIGEVTVQTLEGDEAKICQQQGNATLKNTQAKLDAVLAKLDAAKTSLAYLKNLSKAEQVNIYAQNKELNNIQQVGKQIQQSVTDTNLQINALNIQKAQLQSQLANDKVASGNMSNRVTRISVRLASRTPSKLNLTYLVKGASWKPQYQARLDTKGKKLAVDLQAIIAQTTGENWQNIPLTLSSVTPSYQTALNDPNPQNLNLYGTDDFSADAMSVQAAVPMPKSIHLKKAVKEQAIQALPNFAADIEELSGIVEYKLPQSISIPSDGRRITTKLDSQHDHANVWVRITPDAYYGSNLNAYWYAKAPKFNANWVAGEMNLYRDGNYVGSGQYDAENIQRKGLGFGNNSQIVVTELADDKKSDTKGLFANRNVKNIEKAYRIHNKLANTVNVEVVSGIPVAKNADIKVKSSYVPALTKSTWQDKQGVVAWEFALPANQQQNIRQTHVIEYPKEQELSGLR